MAESIVFDNVSHVYNQGTPFAFHALKDVTVSIPERQITAIVGHTGSGKSTFIQHLNALMRPTHGKIHLFGETITADSKHDSLKWLRKKVGMVFQFPESQLFEETVLKDVMFGPLNFGMNEEQAEQIAREKLRLVGLAPEFYERSPFELSGGQMRRVAIAGVLAQEPEVLVLDEPTAGLDPYGHDQMMRMFVDLQKQQQLTVIMVSHQMDDVAAYADHVMVFERGEKVKMGTTRDIFNHSQWLKDKQLELPHAATFIQKLETALGRSISNAEAIPLTVEEVGQLLIREKQRIEDWNEGEGNV
ncbi:energy-coupling factor transporter ATPase [Aerococcaceae bacterium DSM 111020]|nr:energy-coupling factor transporter ATPase [Aerococcaceae bacterium DSM 111020]